MSVYKRQDSPYYHFDFQLRGHRFHGSTGRTSRREAEAVERAEREKAKALLKRNAGNVATMTMDIAADGIGTRSGSIMHVHPRRSATWTDLSGILARTSYSPRLPMTM